MFPENVRGDMRGVTRICVNGCVLNMRLLCDVLIYVISLCDSARHIAAILRHEYASYA